MWACRQGGVKSPSNVRAQVGRVMRAEDAADAIVAAMLARRPPRELVIGAKARSTLLWGFLQTWVWPGVVERQFCRVFGLTELG